jgi:NAD+ kinase
MAKTDYPHSVVTPSVSSSYNTAKPALEAGPPQHFTLKRLVIFANLCRPHVDKAVEDVVAWCRARSIITCIDARNPSSDELGGTHVWPLTDSDLHRRCESADAAVCLGGDGTLLFAARTLSDHNIPLLAVNMGSVGFHTQATRGDLLNRLQDIADGKFQTETRMMLAISQGDHHIVVLNDVVVTKPDWGHMIHVRVLVNGDIISDVDADSLVVSSATGSSGYNFAAGGPVLAPTMQAMILNAICPHRSRFSPVVLEPDAHVEIRIRRKQSQNEVLVLADGHPWLRARHQDILRVHRAPVALKLVVFRSQFWQQMRDKLRWGALQEP